MSAVRLVCDSTADLPGSDAEEHDITVVPLRVIFGDEEFRDHAEIRPPEFYRRMRTSAVLPRTSQPAPGDFEEAFRRLGGSGDTIICTTISADMSGTYSSAAQARAALPDLDIRLIDSRSANVGHYALIRAAVSRRDAGAGADEIVAAAEAVRDTVRLLFTVESLEYLRRGGRIGGASKLLGNLLNIRPVLTVVDGKVEAFAKVRTYQSAVDRLFEEVRAARDSWGDIEIFISHGDEPDRVAGYVERARAIGGRDPIVLEVGPVIGCHAGPGSAGVAFHPAR